jgi:hypothetical protein
MPVSEYFQRVGSSGFEDIEMPLGDSVAGLVC